MSLTDLYYEPTNCVVIIAENVFSPNIMVFQAVILFSAVGPAYCRCLISVYQVNDLTRADFKI